MKRLEKNISLTSGGVAAGIIAFAIPIIFSNFLQQLYNTADLMIVGKFAGKNPMAAVGATGNIASLLIGLFMGLTTGASVIVAQVYAAEDRENLKKSVHTSYAIAIVGGVLLSIIGYIFSPNLLEMMDTPKEIMVEATGYMRIFFLGVTPLLIYNMGAGILRAVGDSRRPFNFLCVSALVNIILDLILVGYFKKSAIGAGWATFWSQVAAAVLVTYNLVKSDRTFRLRIKKIKFHKDMLNLIFKIGIPTGIQTSVIALSNVLIQVKINGFGSEAIAGIAAESKIDGFIFVALQAIALAATTFAGQNYGAKKYDRIKEGVKVSMQMVLGLAIVLSVLGYIFANQLIAIFNPDPDVVRYGALSFRILATGYWIFGASEVLGAFIRGAGKAVPPMVISVFTMCVLRIIWVFTATNVWPSIATIFISYPLSYFATFILTYLYYKFGNWRMEK